MVETDTSMVILAMNVRALLSVSVHWDEAR